MKKTALKKPGQVNELRRQRGMAMLNKGCSPKEVARRVGVCPATICNWKRRPVGQTGVIQKTGAKLGLSPEQAAQLLKMLAEGATAYGFDPEVWTGKRIAAVIAKHFGVHYHAKSIPALLDRLNWRWQKP